MNVAEAQMKLALEQMTEILEDILDAIEYLTELEAHKFTGKEFQDKWSKNQNSTH